MPLGNPPDPQTGHAGNPGDPIPASFTVSSEPIPVPATATSIPQLATLNEIVMRLATRANRWKAINYLRCLLLVRSVGAKPDAAALSGLTKQLGDVAKTPRLSTVGTAAGVLLIEQRTEHLDYDWFGDQNQSFWEGNVDARADELLIARRLMQYLEGSIGLPLSGDATSSWGWAQGPQVWQSLTAAPPPGAILTPLRIDWNLNQSQSSVSATISNGTLLLKTPRPRDRTGLQFI